MAERHGLGTDIVPGERDVILFAEFIKKRTGIDGIILKAVIHMRNAVIVLTQMASCFDHAGISPSETRAIIFESKVFFRIQLKLGDGAGPSVIDPVHCLENDSQDKDAYQEIP